MGLMKCMHFHTLILLTPPTPCPVPPALPAPQEPLFCAQLICILLPSYFLFSAPLPELLFLCFLLSFIYSFIYKNKNLGPTREET